MAITNNNVQNVKFLRNATIYETREAARTALEDNKALGADGTALLARYSGENETDIKTLAGLIWSDGTNSTVTIIDVEGGSEEVEELRQEINAKLGDGVSSANTVTAQLEALSGNTASTSAETSVEGAKRYADDLISTLDGGITAETGYYVKSVSEVDGKISGTTVAFPDASSVSGDSKVVIDVTQDKGQITATAANLTGVKLDGLTAGTDSKIAATDTLGEALANIQAQIDAMDKTADAENGKVVTTVTEEDGKVTETKENVKDLQLGGYAKTNDTGDIASADTINVALSKLENKAAAITIDNADGSINVTTGANGTDINVNIKSGEKVLAKDGNAGIYTDIKLSAVTPSSTAVKEEYSLIATDGSVLGTNIKIYKDSHIVSITYITDSGDTHYQNLEYVYIDASGDTQTEYVDISSLVLEAEFASGLTIENHVARGVVDPQSEKDSQDTPVDFLTVGADGFKVSGIKDEIDRKINALDATGGTQTIETHKHVAVEVVEANGLITAVTVTEDNIADADDLEELSAKTVTEIGSSNSSISATSSVTTNGTVKYDVVTDADKIKMSGFSADNTSSLSGIAESDSIATAFEKTNAVITENERVTAGALTDLDGRLDVIESGYVETVKVNNVALAESDNAVNVQIESASGATTASTSNAIIVDTDANGKITLGLNYIDCGTY